MTLASAAVASAPSIPRPLPGGPAAHAVAWRPQAKGISRVYLLTIARGESVSPFDRVALLQCGPAGGTHPHASDACRLLDKVHGDISELHASRDTACTKQYDPITISAVGVWDNHHHTVERTFGNPCELRATTGAVFDF
ncbi:SSI family serine proteinase inhibitor [Sphaerisporangium krabiense]|uniref:Subtilisin inhibitor domain-containing protein n=1 Tax=Sphaerisporangium krabiense TaxID=763782 RepID=A0A7W8Z581_9ACTN|nr:SSI family serine proteinase inhibitor [Sphaerisporangium krabiense]MBB5627691.1 hypothetical protein [Sphaerisporangium krabiense]